MIGLSTKGGNQNLLNQPFRISPPSRVLCLKGILNMDDLEIDEEYNDLIEDIREMADKYAEVISIKVPRPIDGDKNIPGLRNFYLCYKSIEDTIKSRDELTKK